MTTSNTTAPQPTIASVSSAAMQNLNNVILPIMRRVMPNVIANSIIGVQPMSGPIGMIYSMRARYVYVKNKIQLSKQHYRKFLRLYDRRQFTYHDDILKAGYFWCNVNDETDIVEWCNSMFGQYGYIHDSVNLRFYFENINDQTAFKMRFQ